MGVCQDVLALGTMLKIVVVFFSESIKDVVIPRFLWTELNFAVVVREGTKSESELFIDDTSK